MIDLALTVIILLSALSGAVIGIIAYQILENANANRTHSTKIHRQDSGHSSRSAAGSEVFCQGECWPVLPVASAWGWLDSDRYRRKD